MKNTLQPENQIIEIISDVTGTPKAHILQTTTLVQGMAMDSLEILTVRSEMEKHFRIDISDDDIATVKTVADLTQIAINKLNPVN